MMEVWCQIARAKRALYLCVGTSGDILRVFSENWENGVVWESSFRMCLVLHSLSFFKKFREELGLMRACEHLGGYVAERSERAQRALWDLYWDIR